MRTMDGVVSNYLKVVACAGRAKSSIRAQRCGGLRVQTGDCVRIPKANISSRMRDAHTPDGD